MDLGINTKVYSVVSVIGYFKYSYFTLNFPISDRIMLTDGLAFLNASINISITVDYVGMFLDSNMHLNSIQAEDNI